MYWNFLPSTSPFKFGFIPFEKSSIWNSQLVSPVTMPCSVPNWKYIIPLMTYPYSFSEHFWHAELLIQESKMIVILHLPFSQIMLTMQVVLWPLEPFLVLGWLMLGPTEVIWWNYCCQYFQVSTLTLMICLEFRLWILLNEPEMIFIYDFRS